MKKRDAVQTKDRSSDFPSVSVVLSMSLLNYQLCNEARRHSYHSGQKDMHDVTIKYFFKDSVVVVTHHIHFSNAQ